MKTTINDVVLTAIKRKRGELNLTVKQLSQETDVSRWTLDKILRGDAESVYPTTKEKLVTWLAKNS